MTLKTIQADEKYTLPRRVIVYGTLKRNFGNHRIISNNPEGSSFVGCGLTKHPFVMIDGGFPMLINGADQKEGLPVFGEVFEVSDREVLRRLDALEGEGDFYHRMSTCVSHQKPDEPEALWVDEWVDIYVNDAHTANYFSSGARAHRVKGAPRITKEDSNGEKYYEF